jgi:hypothetical protein
MNFVVVFIGVLMSAISGLEVYKVLRKIKPNIKMATYHQGIEDL